MIAAFENGVLARLKAASLGQPDAVLPYAWQTLESYPENWDLYLKDKGQIRTPAAWIVFGGWKQPTTRPDGIVAAQSVFMLVVAAENLRNETAQRQGGVGPREPGSYQLLLDATRLLSKFAPIGDDADGIEIGASRSIRPTQAIIERKWSMFALELATTLYVDASTGAADLGDFAAFHANWDVRPFGERPDTLPADATADATDHVILETETP